MSYVLHIISSNLRGSVVTYIIILWAIKQGENSTECHKIPLIVKHILVSDVGKYEQEQMCHNWWNMIYVI